MRLGGAGLEFQDLACLGGCGGRVAFGDCSLGLGKVQGGGFAIFIGGDQLAAFANFGGAFFGAAGTTKHARSSSVIANCTKSRQSRRLKSLWQNSGGLR